MSNKLNLPVYVEEYIVPLYGYTNATCSFCAALLHNKYTYDNKLAYIVKFCPVCLRVYLRRKPEEGEVFS